MTNKSSRMLALLVVGLVALMWVPMGSAHGGNHGTIKVHDNEEAEPDQRNEPHVDCDFWVEGFNMDGSGGELVFYSWPPTGDMTEVMRADWSGEPEDDEDGYHFLAGPFSLPSGHYRVEAFSDEGHPGDHGHFAKAKMFWVDCNGGGEELGCPPLSLTAQANADSSILVSWDTDADMINLYRAEGSGDLEYVGTFEDDETYLDTDTTVGTTYTYAATAFDGEQESIICDQVEVTAIPVFPTAIASVAALAIGSLAYIGLRRRS